MQREIELYLTPKQALEKHNFLNFIIQNCDIKKERIKDYEILKRAVDARKRPVKIYFKFLLYIDEIPAKEKNPILYHKVTAKKKVFIIGSGPAGLFAALEFIKAGIKPIIFERGKPISERKIDIAQLNSLHQLNTDSNYCFGEGGAGTFSDGKLYTRSKKKGDIQTILKTFVEHGASQDILYDASPHIGTDILPRVILSMRETILNYGGEINFNSKLTDIGIKNNVVKSLVINNTDSYDVDFLVLATGHSARDIYHLLENKSVFLEPKPFAVGIRVEHSQELINNIQYHSSDYDKLLPPAQYKLVEQVNGRGVFSFCMCPGGIIVPSATEENQIVVNGMSNSKRNSPFANAGIVVQINADDNIGFKKSGALNLLSFQEAIEKACFTDKQFPQKAPAQRMVDFVKGKLSSNLPDTSYNPGVKSIMLENLLPDFVGASLKQAFPIFDKKMRGFYTNEAILIATESRTSSPVRITRDIETYEHVQIKGLYPCGEGSGYAGGITSSAVDGINCAKAVIGVLMD